MTKKEAIDHLKSLKASGYYLTMDATIALFESLEEAPALSPGDLENLVDRLVEGICDNTLDYLDDYDFTVSNKELLLDSLSLDEHQVSKEFMEIVKDYLS